MAPEGHEVTLRHGFDDLDLDDPAGLASAGMNHLAPGPHHRDGLAGDKAVIDHGLACDEHRIGRDQLAVPQHQSIAHAKGGKGHGLFGARGIAPGDCQGKERSVIAIEGQPGMGLLLEPASAQQEEDETGQAVEIAFPGSAKDFPGALPVERGEAEGDRHIQGEHPLSVRGEGRAPVVRRAEDEHREGEGEAQPPEQLLEHRAAQAVQPQITRQTEQHDVAKGEPGHAGLEHLPLGRRIRRPFLQMPQRQRRFVSERGQQGGYATQPQPIRRVTDTDLAPRKVDLRPADARMQPEQVLEQPDASNAVDGRQVKGNSPRAVVREIEQPAFDLRVIQEGPPRRAAGRIDAHPRMPVQIVEMAQTTLPQQLVHGETAVAAKAFALSLKGGPAAGRAAMVAVQDR